MRICKLASVRPSNHSYRQLTPIHIGVGAELVQFQTQNPKWIDELTKWESTRKPGDLPPGVTTKWTRLESDGQRDYYVSDARWLSRPEVRSNTHIVNLER
jgi:hypothetical protein